MEDLSHHSPERRQSPQRREYGGETTHHTEETTEVRHYNSGEHYAHKDNGGGQSEVCAENRVIELSK